MKKERDYGMNYPMYGAGMPMATPPMAMPGMPGMCNQMNPGMMGMTPTMPTMPTNPNYSSLVTQINNLEKRVARLESVAMTSTPDHTYSESNFYMV